MLVPINTAKRNDLALSIVTTKDGYSVLVVSIINSYGPESIPSYMCNYPTSSEDAFDPGTWIENYPAVVGPDLYKCIEDVMKQIEDLMQK